MLQTYTYKKVTWTDLENPTRDEVRSLTEKYNIHPLAAEELIVPSRSKVDVYDDYIYLVLHFPAWKHSHTETVQEVDFIIGKNHIITARYDSVDPIHKFAKMLEVNSVLEHNETIGSHAGYMFYYMMREIYHSLHDELESIKDTLNHIEQHIFKGKEKEMVLEISNVSRELLSFRHATSLHEEALVSFAQGAEKMFGAEFSKHMETITKEYLKIEKTTAGLFDSLSELRQTNMALLETKQNKIMMTFTAITIISSMMTIILNWFLIQSADTPFNESPHEFVYVGLVTLATALIVALIMKIKKWL